MKERTKIIGKDFEILFHFDPCANRIVELDQAGEDEKRAHEVARELIEKFLHILHDSQWLIVHRIHINAIGYGQWTVDSLIKQNTE